MGGRLANVDLIGCPPKVVGAAIKAFAHLFLSCESLNNTHAAQSLFELGHCIAPLVLCIERFVFKFAPDLAHYPPHNRQDDERKERQLPTRINQDTEIAEEENGVLDQHIQRTRYRVFDLVYVAAHARHNISFALIREEGERETDNLVVNAAADVANNARAHRNHYADGGEIATRLQQSGRDEKQADEEERGGGAVDVDQVGRVVI